MNKRTEDALILLISAIYAALDNDFKVNSVYLDLMKTWKQLTDAY